VRQRELGRTGIHVGEIGFGTEHLPPDREVIAEIVETGVMGGATFIDILQTDPAGDGAYVWDGLGPAIREHREKLALACHWGIGYRYDLDYCRETFPEALARVGNDFVDVAMMTMVGEPGRTGAWLDDSLAELERYRRDGQIGSSVGVRNSPSAPPSLPLPRREGGGEGGADSSSERRDLPLDDAIDHRQQELDVRQASGIRE